MMEISAKLLLLLDSRSPAGAHSHSAGMESAVMAGYISTLEDVRDFCAGRLRTSGRVAAAFAAVACQAWHDEATAQHWFALDREYEARLASEAVRTASRALGGGLRRLVQATAPEADLRTPWREIGAAPHQPLVLGAGCALAGGTPLLAARSAALSCVTAPGSAAIRLLGLDPYGVHGIAAELADDVELVALEAADLPNRTGLRWLSPQFLAQLPSDSAPALDLLADVHHREEMRLFAS